MIAKYVLSLSVILFFVNFTAAPSAAQLTRESDASSVAGMLQRTVDEFDDYLVASREDQILIADLDAALFIDKSVHSDSDHDSGSENTAEPAADPDAGGCGGPGSFSSRS